MPDEEGQSATVSRLAAGLEEAVNFPRVSIVVLNWNGLEDTIDILTVKALKNENRGIERHFCLS